MSHYCLTSLLSIYYWGADFSTLTNHEISERWLITTESIVHAFTAYWAPLVWYAAWARSWAWPSYRAFVLLINLLRRTATETKELQKARPQRDSGAIDNTSNYGWEDSRFASRVAQGDLTFTCYMHRFFTFFGIKNETLLSFQHARCTFQLMSVPVLWMQCVRNALKCPFEGSTMELEF